jgi:sugar lactone lactonase YvrE
MKFAIRIACMLAGLAVFGLDGSPAHAGAGLVADPGPTSQAPTNSAPNRYRRIKDFFKLPPGRTMGSSSAVAVDHEGHLWVADRCGANDCAGSRSRWIRAAGCSWPIAATTEFRSRSARPAAAIWRQFGRPSGLYIDGHDVLYASDSESRNSKGYGYHPGWNRGVRIGSARDGVVTAFIPDLEPDQESKDTTGGEGVAADGRGTVFTADVDPREIVKFAAESGEIQ